MITNDFTQRTRTRIAEMRVTLAKLREAHKDASRQLTRVAKQHDADKTRVQERLGKLADDVVELPEEVPETELDNAYEVQEQVHKLAADVEELFLVNSLEDLGDMLDTISELYADLKKAETQLAKVESFGTKLGV